IRERAVASLVKLHLPRPAGVGAALAKVSELMSGMSGQGLGVVVEPDVAGGSAGGGTVGGRGGRPGRGSRRAGGCGRRRSRGRGGVPELLTVVREDRDFAKRFEATRALRKVGDPTVAESFVELLNINNDSVRLELMATLGSFRYRGAVPELTRIVEQATKTD